MNLLHLSQAPDAPSFPPSASRNRVWNRWEMPWLKSPWFLGLFLVLIVVALYANSLHGNWIYDDYSDILGNESVQRLWPLGEHFLQRAGGQLGVSSRPLVSLSFALNFLFGRNDPFLFHLTNVAIHALATLCFFGLVRRTLLLLSTDTWTPPSGNLLAFTAALLWGIHPLQTEAVAYITQRYECLMGLFVLLTLLCVVRSVQSRSPNAWTAAAAFSCLLALSSKEVAVSLPILVMLYDRAFLSGSFLKAWRARRPLYLALVLTWALFLLNQAHVIGRTFAGFALPMPWWQYAMNQPAVILHYLRLAFWPNPLVLDYAWPPAPSLGPLIPGFFVVGGLLFATIVAHFRSPRWGFLGAFFVLILAPTSSVMPILDLAVEHRMYLPLAPVLVAFVLGIHYLAHGMVSKRPGLAAPIHFGLLGGGALAVALLGSLTFLRSDDYRSSLNIWLDTVIKRPNNPRAHANYAHALREVGNLDEAIHQSRIALELSPDNFTVVGNLGGFLAVKGKYEEAIKVLQHASRLNPNDPKPWVNLGMVYRNMNNLEKARECVQMALVLDPRLPQAHFEMGNVLIALESLDLALVHYHQSTRFRPGFSLSHWGAGRVLLKQGRLTDALQEFREYIRLEPSATDAKTMVGQALYAEEMVPEALRYWQQALQHDPKHLQALLLSSWALSTNPQTSFRNGQEALRFAEVALQAKPGNPAAMEALGAAYAELGRFPEACAVMEEVIQKLKAAQFSGLAVLEARLELYRKAKPFRENPSKAKSRVVNAAEG